MLLLSVLLIITVFFLKIFAVFIFARPIGFFLPLVPFETNTVYKKCVSYLNLNFTVTYNSFATQKKILKVYPQKTKF